VTTSNLGSKAVSGNTSTLIYIISTHIKNINSIYSISMTHCFSAIDAALCTSILSMTYRNNATTPIRPSANVKLKMNFSTRVGSHK
jgi:hypothetical protein